MLSIAPGEHISEPIELAVYGPQVHVNIGEYAQVTMRDVLSGAHASMQRTIVLGAHSCVRYQCLLDEGCRFDTKNTQQVRNKSGVHKLGGQKTSVRVHVILQGDYANFESCVRVYGISEHVLEIELVQEHGAPYTSSLFDVKQVLSSGMQSSVRGSIVVSAQAAHARAEQQIKSLVLEYGHQPGAAVRMCPELRVANNTASVKHGCAVGELDREQVLYLQARGISESQAQKLLIDGFLSCT